MNKEDAQGRSKNDYESKRQINTLSKLVAVGVIALVFRLGSGFEDWMTYNAFLETSARGQISELLALDHYLDSTDPSVWETILAERIQHPELSDSSEESITTGIYGMAMLAQKGDVEGVNVIRSLVHAQIQDTIHEELAKLPEDQFAKLQNWHRNLASTFDAISHVAFDVFLVYLLSQIYSWKRHASS